MPIFKLCLLKNKIMEVLIMGSSVRKTSAKISKLLKDTISLDPSVDSKDVIPQVAEQTLRSRKTKSYFGDKDFAILAGGGFACLKKAKEIGFDNFLQEYNIVSEKLNFIEVQKIIETILDKIEEERGEIDSLMILSAFQSTMTKMLLNKLDEPEEFLNSFCETFITMVIREDASEELTAAFKDTSVDILNKNIEDFAEKYVHINFSDIINQCNKGEIQVEQLIIKMQDKLGKTKE